MANAPYVPLRPIPMKERSGIIFLQYGQLDVLDSAFVLVDVIGVRTQVPVGGLACIMLEPGRPGGAGRLPARLGRRGRRQALRFGPARRGKSR